MWRPLATTVLGLALLAGCTDDPEPSARTGSPSYATPGSPSDATPTDLASDPPAERAEPFDADAVLADVRRFANRIGPREATSPGFRRAARFVAQRLRSLGYDVGRTRVPVPAGDSWGVPVDAGTSYNVIADPPGFDATKPYRIVGAHLDSVAVSPGAEDNASGTSVLLELARMASEQPPDVPTRLIAFGAEEPRGESDDLHHFGSRQYVRRMSGPARRNLDGMVALDRVGVRAPAVPICTGGPNGSGLRREVERTARAARVPHATCDDNRASDHWSFEKAGLPAIRLGSVPYAGYHSAQDRPHYVDDREVRRVGRIMWRWLRSP
ncbi:M28 family metallopeptidase [Solicola gregarius]|uniref:M28 family metallopeptidase n=1 Tax=Solicola gregarius TaxID=2908642 RepID=A0AA46YJH7_9ACTN|nr:M28 family metallopeptidase [Solicola gregarius]UYM04560.1 M28 family metallopeptidase [Solicola gregarius]